MVKAVLITCIVSVNKPDYKCRFFYIVNRLEGDDLYNELTEQYADHLPLQVAQLNAKEASKVRGDLLKAAYIESTHRFINTSSLHSQFSKLNKHESKSTVVKSVVKSLCNMCLYGSDCKCWQSANGHNHGKAEMC